MYCRCNILVIYYKLQYGIFQYNSIKHKLTIVCYCKHTHTRAGKMCLSKIYECTWGSHSSVHNLTPVSTTFHSAVICKILHFVGFQIIANLL